MRWIAKGKEHKFALPALISYIEDQSTITRDLARYGVSVMPKDKTPKTSEGKADKPLPVHHTSPGVAVKKFPRKDCPICFKSRHELTKCFKFERLSVAERWMVARLAGYCFRCLKSPHHHDSCEETTTCGRCGDDKHHTILHQMSAPHRSSADRERGDRTSEDRSRVDGDRTTASAAGTTPTTTPEESTPAEAAVARPLHAVGSEARATSKTMLKIVPVLVNGDHPTYAFIDGGQLRRWQRRVSQRV